MTAEYKVHGDVAVITMNNPPVNGLGHATRVGLTATPIFVRLTRGQVMAVKVEDYVEAARAVGNPPARIAVKHILPNILPALIVQATISIAAAKEASVASGQSIVKLDPTAVAVQGQRIGSVASTFHEIMGAIVKIN